MDEEVKVALGEYNAALKAVLGPGKNKNGDERVYGRAYQRLVKLGVAMQLKGKYRG